MSPVGCCVPHRDLPLIVKGNCQARAVLAEHEGPKTGILDGKRVKRGLPVRQGESEQAKE